MPITEAKCAQEPAESTCREGTGDQTCPAGAEVATEDGETSAVAPAIRSTAEERTQCQNISGARWTAG